MSADGTAAPSVSTESSPEPRDTERGARFEALVDAHLGWLRGWLRGRAGGDESLVEDLVQEAFLRAFRNFPGLRDRDRFGAWLYRTAQNLLRDHLRQKTRRRTTLLPTDALDRIERESGEDPGSLVRRETAERLLETIRELPARYREPLLLCHAEDLSYEEVGKILGVGRDVLRVRLCRARKMLRARLGPHLDDAE